MNTPTQRAAALRVATATRLQVGEIRRQLCDGSVELRDLLMDPPAELQSMALVDIVRLTRPSKCDARRLGALAVRSDVNLLLPLGVSSQRSRIWLAAHVPPKSKMRKAA